MTVPPDVVIILPIAIIVLVIGMASKRRDRV